MDATLKSIVWHQFGAAIDMLDNAIVVCPDPLWGDRSRRPEYWYLVFHTLFFLDLYLSPPGGDFAPPAPFTLDELDPAAAPPDRPYTKDELLAYLRHGRRKCQSTLAALTDAQASERCRFGWGEVSRLELLLYNMRHVQHHAAQMNLVLRQAAGFAPGWVAQAREEAEGEGR